MGFRAYVGFWFHCSPNPVGSYEANQVLSARRADSVSQFLRSNGVDPSRLQTFGAGSSSPIAPNDTTVVFRRRLHQFTGLAAVCA
ncbi:OmpA family protein [Pseudomonas aeruginosa]|uniref:OmpA family protein n=1 Tax=Pseudomonas aeruginosa TaxID=287 RepID=UPI0021B13248|nr:OmpA family protein [Pseudomonas aeruginosa]